MHLCPACGGVVTVPVEGGAARCDVCALEIQFAPRNDSPLAEGQRHDTQAWRRELLRQQPLPDETPADVRVLRTGGRLPAGTEAEVLERWQLARAAVDATGSHEADVRFLGLTLALADHLVAVDDNLELRAVLETALETLTAPQYQQLILVRLARAAMHVDDLPSAEDWLLRCYPHADELRADSAYRVAAAELALRSGKPEVVLEMIGSEVGEWPLHPDERLLAALLRVSAHERRGHVDKAVQLLSELMAISPEQAELVETCIRDSGELRLCQRSFALARDVTEPSMRSSQLPAPTPPRSAPDPVLRRALPWCGSCVVVALAAAWAHTTLWMVAGRRVDVLLLGAALLLALPAGVILLRGGQQAG